MKSCGAALRVFAQNFDTQENNRTEFLKARKVNTGLLSKKLARVTTLLLIGLLAVASAHAADITSCGYLDSDNTTYVLQNDVSSNGSCFAIIADDVTLDLNGHTVTYDNGPIVDVPNGDFENGSGAAASNWDFSNAPNIERRAGTYVDPVTLYSGNYALAVPLPTSDQYIRSSSQVTLAPNTTYAISAMFFNPAGDDAATLYVELEGSGARVEYSNRSWRGFRYATAVIHTEAVAESYIIRAGVQNGSGSGTVYIDDIQIRRFRPFGVVAGIRGWRLDTSDWSQHWYPDFDRDGSAYNAKVINGTIIGTGKGHEAHAVYLSVGGAAEVTGVDATVRGPNAKNILGSVRSGFNIHHNTLRNLVSTIESRDHFDGGAIDFGATPEGEIHNNTILGGVQNGIILSGQSAATPVLVHDNNITLNSKYSNCFAIQGYGDIGSRIYNNTITCHEGSNSCRGIFVGGSNSAQSKIYNNTVSVQSLPRNQEYSGCSLGGAYGIQIESSNDVEVYGNSVTAVARECEAHAFRTNVAPEDRNIYVHDNHFTANKLDASLRASSTKLADLLNATETLLLERNLLTTNSRWLDSAFLDGFHFRSNTFQYLGTPAADEKILFVYDWRTDGEWAAKNIKFVDNSYSDQNSEGIFESATITAINSSATPQSYFYYSWFLEAAVKDRNGDSLAGASVVVRDSTGAQVFSGTTASNGRARAIVDEFRNQAGSMTYYNPHTMTVSYESESSSRTISAYSSQRVDFTLDVEGGSSGGGGGSQGPGTDSDGDGVSDEQEGIDGSNPYDRGSNIPLLSSTLCSEWNGFLGGMWNIAEHVNLSSTEIRVQSTLYDINGTARGVEEFVVAAGAQQDLLVHDMEGYELNSYGKVCSTVLGGAPGSLDGRMVYYKEHAGSDEYQFAFAMGFQNGTSGKQYVPFNTYQPSLDLIDADNLVTNWIQITSLENSTQTGTLTFFAQDGSLLGSENVELNAGARQDFSGHQFGRDLVGMVEWDPDNASALFQFRNVRYFYDNPFGEEAFDSAFQLEGLVGSGELLAVPLDTRSGSSIVEVSNTRDVPEDAVLRIYDESGQQLDVQQFTLQAHASVHIIADAILPGRQGVASIQGASSSSLIAVVMQYERSSSQGIEFLYGIAAKEALGGVLRGSYNTFLNQGCRLLLTNPRDSETTVSLSMVRYDGESVLAGEEIDVPAHGTVDYNICEKDHANAYGVVTVQQQVVNSLLGCVVRVGSGNNYRFPTLVRQ